MNADKNISIKELIAHKEQQNSNNAIVVNQTLKNLAANTNVPDNKNIKNVKPAFYNLGATTAHDLRQNRGNTIDSINRDFQVQETDGSGILKTQTSLEMPSSRPRLSSMENIKQQTHMMY